MTKLISISTMYSYLWKAKWEIITEYVILDSIQDALIDTGIYSFLNWGSSKTLIHDCSSHSLFSSTSSGSLISRVTTDNRIPQIARNFATLFPALLETIQSSNSITRPLSAPCCASAHTFPTQNTLENMVYCGTITNTLNQDSFDHVPNTETSEADQINIANTANPIDITTSWLQNYAWSFTYHMVVKSTATAAFPLVYYYFTNSHNCGEGYSCKKFEYFVEEAIKYSSINPLEGLYAFDKIIGDNLIKYFPNYIESRATDSDYKDFMDSYTRWMELIDAGMHILDLSKNIWQNIAEPYMWAKVPALTGMFAIFKSNTDTQEEKIDLLIENSRNNHLLEIKDNAQTTGNSIEFLEDL